MCVILYVDTNLIGEKRMTRFIMMLILTIVFFISCSVLIVDEPTIQEEIQFTVENGLMFPYHKNARVMEQFEAAETFVSKNQNWHLGVIQDE